MKRLLPLLALGPAIESAQAEFPGYRAAQERAEGPAIRAVDAVDDGRHVRALGGAGQHHPSGPGTHVLFGVLAYFLAMVAVLAW